jgi:hypothetical protein
LEHDQITCKAANGRPMLIVATNHHAEILLNNDVASSRFLVQSVASIKGITYHDKMSTLYWITTEGVSRSNSGGQSLIYKINDLMPSGLALDKTTGNIYYSALKNTSRAGQSSQISLWTVKRVSCFGRNILNLTLDGLFVLLWTGDLQCGCIRLTRLCIRPLLQWIPSSHVSTGPISHFNPFLAVITTV